MLFREDKVARADADAIRKGVGFYRWTHDLVEITGKDALEVLQKIYISDISKVAVGRSKYTASLDENGENEDGEVYLYRYDNSTGSPVLDNIESDEEYDAVADMFDQMLDAAEYDELVEADGEDIDVDETV